MIHQIINQIVIINKTLLSVKFIILKDDKMVIIVWKKYKIIIGEKAIKILSEKFLFTLNKFKLTYDANQRLKKLKMLIIMVIHDKIKKFK